jgi:hypothetical protein
MTVNTTRLAQRLAAIAAQPAIAIEPTSAGGDETRLELRRSVFRFARVVLADRTEVSCIVTDISVGGARIMLEGACALPEWVKLKLILTGELRRARVVWQRDRAAGLSFHAERRPNFGGASDPRR